MNTDQKKKVRKENLLKLGMKKKVVKKNLKRCGHMLTPILHMLKAQDYLTEWEERLFLTKIN